MREIKFRAWQEGSQTMYWPDEVVGFFVHSDGAWVEVTDGHSAHSVALMQYTGLHDKNGREIYEGDLVSIYCAKDAGIEEGMTAIFEVEHVGLGFNAKLISSPKKLKSSWTVNLTNPNCVEVIGNTYENPELLPKD